VLDVDDLPLAEIEALGSTGSERIDTLVRDLVERSAEAGDIVQGSEAGAAMDRLRTFMFERVYLGPDSRREAGRIERLMRSLFEFYAENPPPAIVADAGEAERVVDWLAGMTDRFALRAFGELSVPRGF
jgi:dGTPase